MVTTSSEDLQTISNNLCRAGSNHRDTQELYRALKQVSQLEKKLQNDTGIEIHKKVIAYFNKVSKE